MDTLKNLNNYKLIQSYAKKVLQDMSYYIKPGLTEKDIVLKCFSLFKQLGIESSWYHNVMAFVLIGERTTLSISGKKYKADEIITVNSNDLVTIDVSPSFQDFWGDCSRSYTLHDNKVYLDEPCGINELDEGVFAEIELHEFLKKISKPDMTLGDLYNIANQKISEIGYKNLDFKGNLGHTIEKELAQRKFIETGNSTKLKELSFFTFEPHICKPTSKWGFKRENVYYFERDRLVEL